MGPAHQPALHAMLPCVSKNYVASSCADHYPADTILIGASLLEAVTFCPSSPNWSALIFNEERRSHARLFRLLRPQQLRVTEDSSDNERYRGVFFSNPGHQPEEFSLSGRSGYAVCRVSGKS